jgi:hypothetical protein
MHTFIAPITSRAITTDHNLAIITGRNRATTGQVGVDTEVGKSSNDGRRHLAAYVLWPAERGGSAQLHLACSSAKANAGEGY